jgi:predicted dienelactone hydrolase
MLVLATSLAAMTSLLADSLPAPTGPHPVGRIAFHWIDTSRAELETRAPEDKRELLVYVFYPAERAGGGKRAAYMPEAEAMRGAWGNELTQTISGLESHTLEAPPLLRGRAKLPVVLFAPGGGQKTLAYTVFLEELASHGYVVAAIEPPYNAPAVQFPNGKTLGRLAPSEKGWEEPKNRDDMPRIYQQMVLHWAKDMIYVLNELEAHGGMFANRIDTSVSLHSGIRVEGRRRERYDCSIRDSAEP